jgi:F-type H+-transporting ATPase subunit epsilon
MRFMIMTPDKMVDELEISRLSAEGEEGSFVILPGHIDLLSILKRSIVTIQDEDEAIRVYAADGGFLTKEGDTLRVSSPFVVKGEKAVSEDPEEGLAAVIEKSLKKLERESTHLQTGSFRLETDIVRRMVELRGEL